MTLKFGSAFRRLKVAPFEGAFAAINIFMAISALTRPTVQGGIFNHVVGLQLSAAFNVGYVMAGVAMLIGIAFGRRELEGSGLILLAASLLMRTIAVGWVFGLMRAGVALYVVNGLLIGAVIIRLISLFQRKTLIQVTTVKPE